MAPIDPVPNRPAGTAARSISAILGNFDFITTYINSAGWVTSNHLVDGTIVSGDIADGTIVNADINAAAGIVGSKLADSSIPASKLDAALSGQLGLNSSGGTLYTAGEESTTSAGYTSLTTPDQISNVVVPSNGLLEVNFSALWRGTHATGATTFGAVALFVGGNQMRGHSIPPGPVVLSTALNVGGGAATVATGDGAITNALGGAIEGNSNAALDQSFVSTGIATISPSLVRIPAGTYNVGMRFLASAGCTVYAKERLLKVRTF